MVNQSCSGQGLYFSSEIDLWTGLNSLGGQLTMAGHCTFFPIIVYIPRKGCSNFSF